MVTETLPMVTKQLKNDISGRFVPPALVYLLSVFVQFGGIGLFGIHFVVN